MLKYLVVLGLLATSCTSSPKSQRVNDLTPYDSSNAPVYGDLHSDDDHYPLLEEKSPFEKKEKKPPRRSRYRNSTGKKSR